ncbi:hypothetical protein A7U60_g1886 [Sanghuangporus baumii]|uniref:THO complex subunit 2 n=1 Tax=Sanghuangporus baumii TaxID=108892 RepID=A0A9Q5I467_SANBA|nr:hypothetical protein A7U60_g1886 [Sanghuangporus baumii]
MADFTTRERGEGKKVDKSLLAARWLHNTSKSLSEGAHFTVLSFWVLLMDVLSHVKTCLGKWQSGGEAECRSFLTSHHCQIDDPASSDVLATAYQSLLHAVLRIWSPESKPRLAPEDLVAFIHSVFAELPSSSSPSTERSRNLVSFGELLVDNIWAIDGELDEIISDAKGVVASRSSEAGKERGNSDEVAKASEMQKTAESDKDMLSQLLKLLLRAGIVDPYLCRERLDTALLTSSGLIADKVLFEKKEVRARTGLFYKQNKFNLLREQSEGYTKLTTDLIGSLGPPNDLSSALPVESFEAAQSRAASVWERVVSLIGYFDLDPNRALDIILDVFSVNIATHWHFFLSLLACSPWVGEHTRLRDWTEDIRIDSQADRYRGKTLDEILHLAENGVQGADTPAKPAEHPKPKVLAQVLGFKFRHYQSPDTKASCPRGLYLVAALLIRGGFISLEDLYPHLSPSDEDMPKLQKKYMDDVQSRFKSSSNNLLAMAAPLESSSLSYSSRVKTPAVEAKPTPEVKEPPVQKAMLAVALLSVGVLRPAVALITRYPWLVDVHHELADLLLRVLKASIDPLFEKLFSKERNKGFLQPRPRYASPGVLVHPLRKPQLTLCAPPPPSTSTQDFVFFYPQWTKWVPVCEGPEDIVDIVEPLMRLAGVHLSRDPLFLTKLLRIGRTHLSQSITAEPENKESRRSSPILDPENRAQEFWLHTARRYLLPALSMMPGNAVCTVEVWNILRFYDVTVRWRLYGEWRDETYKTHPELNVQRVLREREAKGILRRLSSQTVESLAGTVAKMAHANPCIFFTNAVNQIQAYDNLADVVIQALRFATNMGFDVLVFLIIDALANPHKDRLKEDGANAADWLQSLATFSGALFRRYSTDSSSLLRYIVHQLYNGQTSEIVVLEKLIYRMAGIEPLPSLSDAQITAMAGGPTLRTEAVASELRGAGLDTSEALTKGPQRLGKTLIDTKLAFPLLVQVAQQRQACVFKARDAHLKSIAHLFDATHGVLNQYLDLLTTPIVVPLDEYRKIIPPLPELVNVYGVSPAIAMQIYRPMLNDAIAVHASTWCKAGAAAQEKRLKAALAAKREPSAHSTATVEGIDSAATHAKSERSNPATAVEKMEIDGTDVKAGASIAGAAEMTAEVKSEDSDSSADQWVPELRALFEDCKQISPGNTVDVIGPGFYLSFWQMSSYDLYYPKDKYSEMERSLLAASDSLTTKARQAERSTDRSTRASATGFRAQRDRYISAITELRKEKTVQESVFRYTTGEGGRLEREKKYWFSHVASGNVKGGTFIRSFIEHCIQPRCLLSPMDAVYCARLIRTLHARGTPGFHTLMCYDKLLGDHVKVVIFTCSENEARNYGLFLRVVLQDLYEWHKDQKAYEASLSRKEDSKIIPLPGLQPQWSKDGPSSLDDLLKWSGFRSFLTKCHRKLGQCFTDCIQAGDFMHVYNAVLVLKEIIEVFPIAAVNEVVGSRIDLEIQKLVQSEERGDLKILARAYSSSLKKREKLWAMPKDAQPSKSVAGRATSSHSVNQMEKPREAPAANPPTGPRSSQPSLPPGPEKVASTAIERPSSAARLALESVPKPEVVKRNRDTRSLEVATAEASKNEDPMQVDRQLNGHDQVQNKLPPTTGTSRPKDEVKPLHPSIPLRPGKTPLSTSSNDLRKEVLQGMNVISRPATPLSSPATNVAQNGIKDSTQSSPRLPSRDPGSPMPPPAEPSQAPHAQELRNSRRSENIPSSPREAAEVPPARRSSSPATRPGTRNASADSRASGEGKRDRQRHERSSDTGEGKRSVNADLPSRAERSSGAHRDAHGRSERSGRDRIPGSSTRDTDRERDTDRDRARDRDRDKPRDRERERSHRGDRESHRERERDRERDRTERDRHRRDDKDRERERKPSGQSKEPDAPLSHTLPARPDGQRHRTHADSSPGDVSLGKRRRTPDDESERSAKRSTRQREDRSRKHSEKDASREPNRESDRRRKEKDAEEDELHLKGAGTEKAEKMLFEQPYERSRENEVPSNIPAMKITVPPPSAPRAMAGPSPRVTGHGDTSPAITREKEDRERSTRDRADRGGRGERLQADRDIRNDGSDRSETKERDDRDRSERNQRGEREWKEGPGRGTQNGTAPSPSLGSLRDRISHAPSANSSRGNVAGDDDHGDRLKRSLSDRDREGLQVAAASAMNTPPSQQKSSSKRIRIDRSRIGGDGTSGSNRRSVRQ